MKKKTIKYKDENIGHPKVIPDFLPKPKDLIMKEELVKVTLALTKESVDFFKDEARSHHTQYQKMIRTLLERYASHYNNKS